MSKRDDFNCVTQNKIDDLEWKSPHDIPPTVFYVVRPAFWRFQDSIDRSIDFLLEPNRRDLASLSIP